MTEKLNDRMYGCIVGGAIGDALGAAVEGSSYDRINEEYGKVRTFKPYDLPYSSGEPGTVTDDTVIRSHIYQAIDENGGRITPEDYAEVLRSSLNSDDIWVPEEIVKKKLLLGMNPWDTGREMIPTSIMASAIQPIGAVNACNPDQAYQDAMNIAAVHQDKTHRDAAAIVSAGVAEAFSPGTSISDVLNVMRAFAPDLVGRAIDLTMALTEHSGSVDEFAEVYYDEMLDWRWPAVSWGREKYEAGLLFSDDTLESVPIAMAILELCDGEVEQAIVEAASFGRNSDAIASITGSIAGTLSGAEDIPSNWIRECESANTELFETVGCAQEEGFRAMSENLVAALEQERERAVERVDELDKLLEQ